jgi:hypothetical protein
LKIVWQIGFYLLRLPASIYLFWLRQIFGPPLANLIQAFLPTLHDDLRMRVWRTEWAPIREGELDREVDQYFIPVKATPSMMRVRKIRKTTRTGSKVMTHAAMIPP